MWHQFSSKTGVSSNMKREYAETLGFRFLVVRNGYDNVHHVFPAPSSNPCPHCCARPKEMAISLCFKQQCLWKYRQANPGHRHLEKLKKTQGNSRFNRRFGRCIWFVLDEILTHIEVGNPVCRWAHTYMVHVWCGFWVSIYVFSL